jgi:hypothetical protein
LPLEWLQDGWGEQWYGVLQSFIMGYNHLGIIRAMMGVGNLLLCNPILNSSRHSHPGPACLTPARS